MTPSVEEISEHLLKHNIKPSYQRIKILEYLVTKRNHPTADEIHKELVKEIPSLSKTTIYNTLKTFIETNLARVITIEENETRYDADISDHGHFKCDECGSIYDFRVNIDILEPDELESFKINEKNVYYSGICKKCISKEEG